jgi:hypothetical protein
MREVVGIERQRRGAVQVGSANGYMVTGENIPFAPVKEV